MSSSAERPDTLAILGSLKDFQRKTAEYVFRRLYLDNDPAKRFLIADEVGLGKTLVARGIVAKAVDHLWDKVKRIDIVYICANRDIARQNVNRLNITRQEKMAIATRMTLLPLHLHNLQGSKINFVSFTPGTSFNLRSVGGIAYERAMIYHILRQGWGLGDSTAPKNLLQLGMSKDGWREMLRDFDEEIDQSLKESYLAALEENPDVRQRFDALLDCFGYARIHIPDDERRACTHLIGDLRRILAQSCVKALEPDIVILDEFQRFKTLLDTEEGDEEQKEVARLAYAVFNHPDAKVLLLSATPYKMYTMYHEQEVEDHYTDFLRTVGFLFDDKSQTEAFKEDLVRYRRALLQFATRGGEALLDAKQAIETKLRRIMVRTERISVTADHDSMIESVSESAPLAPSDLESFAMLDRVAAHLDAGDTVEYWKSAPFLLNIMDKEGYSIKRKFLAQINGDDHPELANLLGSLGEGQLSWDGICRYQAFDPANAKLRGLLRDKVERGAWQLLWIPASLPYYRSADGPYAKAEAQDFTKALIFSSWVVVPKVIAMLASYEVERRMVTAFDPEADYPSLRKKRRPLLQFALSQDRLTGMANFCLVYPCLTLAARIDPLQIAVRLSENGTLADAAAVLDAVTVRVRELLAPIVRSVRTTESSVDERWYWAAMALLDRLHFPGVVESWLDDDDEETAWSGMVRSTDETDGRFKDHLDEFRRYLGDAPSLGRPPDDLFTVLAKAAMASPAVVCLRSLLRVCGYRKVPQEADALLAGAARMALGFRSMFNLPESISLIRSLKVGDDSRYWESVLDYAVDGNLQSVMDEYVHILRESLGLIDARTDDEAADNWAKQISEAVLEAVSIRTVSLGFDEIVLDKESGRLRPVDHSMRCRFALRFGDDRGEEEGSETRRDQVRAAFNSPFRPFVLASTSIGQEGLDFHQYCHEIYHWNLPSNPIDLEQREGRIHRYKGHVIRRNVAKSFPLSSFCGQIDDGEDPWETLFALARSRYEGKCELIPYWIFEDGGHRILRRIPSLPLSRDVEHLENLRRTIVAYRLVLGQPRQEDLVRYLCSRMDGGASPQDLIEYRINLSPRAFEGKT